MSRNQLDFEDNLCVMFADELSSISHWCCFFCILFAFTHGPICCGFLSVNLVLGIPITATFPVFQWIILRLETFGLGAEFINFYLLISNVVIIFPFIWIASLGSKNFVSLVTSIIFGVYSCVELTSYLTLAFMQSPNESSQWIFFLILLIITLATLAFVSLSLHVRIRQRRALLAAKLIKAMAMKVQY